MDLLALRYFQAVARLEHVSRAAEELRVAQPSVSRTIARLESELGVPLFDRRGRQIVLNRFGAAFLRRTDRILGEIEDAQRELTDAAGLDEGSVAVAAETLLTLTTVLTPFLDRHPRVQVRLSQASAPAMTELLSNREIDFCLASQQLDVPGLCTVRLLSEPVLLAVPLGHPLASRQSVAIVELADEPFVTTRVGNWQRALTDRLFEQVALTPNIVCEGDEPAATHYLISAGLGVGLIPEMARRAKAHAPVALLDVEDPGCIRALDLVWREDAFLSTAAHRFRDLAVSVFAQQAAPPPGAHLGS